MSVVSSCITCGKRHILQDKHSECVFCKLKTEGFTVLHPDDELLKKEEKPFKKGDYVKVDYCGKERKCRFSHFSKTGAYGFVIDDYSDKEIKKAVEEITLYEPDFGSDISGGFDVPVTDIGEDIPKPKKEPKPGKAVRDDYF